MAMKKPLEVDTTLVANTKTYQERIATEPTVKSYEDNKNRRIQVQGILQACIQSPSTINFGDDVDVIATKTLQLVDRLLTGMDERI